MNDMMKIARWWANAAGRRCSDGELETLSLRRHQAMAVWFDRTVRLIMAGAMEDD